MKIPRPSLLVIVDPQLDFITGTLPVPGAAAAIDALAAYVAHNAGNYSGIAVTLDLHPQSHLSFSCHGGPWPVHCVEGTEGASVWPSLKEQLSACTNLVTYFGKGRDTDKEEYSFLANEGNRRQFESLLADKGINRVDVCGLAGDVCVARTVADLRCLYPALAINVLEEYSPCIA